MDFEVQGRDIQTRGSSACSSLNRCEPGLPNNIPVRGVIDGHIERPDTRPIEDPAETSKITLAKQGASTRERFRAAVEAQTGPPDAHAPAVRRLGGWFVDLGHPDDKSDT